MLRCNTYSVARQKQAVSGFVGRVARSGAVTYRELPSCSPGNLCKSLRKQEFATSIVGEQLTVQRHQALGQSPEFAATPTAKLLRKVRLVPKEDASRSHLLLKKRVDIASSPHPSGKLCQLSSTPFEGQHKADRIELKLVHSGQF